MGSAAESSAASPHISAVIFDLDGTLLNTEDITRNVMKDFLARYGKVQDSEKDKRRLGKTFYESYVAMVTDYDLPLTLDEYVKEITPLYHGTWLLAKPLPGVNRLIKHLHKHGVPMAVASNSSTDKVVGKISHQEGWKEKFTVILGSDQVEMGKPAPDLFLEVAKRMGVDSSCCLVVEDSFVGVKAGKAARMSVVAVPSLQNVSDSYFIADSILHSLLEFQPEQWGLPQFEDWVGDALPIEPLCLTGVLSNGLFRANTDNGVNDLPCQIWGLYIGWAKLDGQKVLKTVISMGCRSSEQTIEPCLIGGDYDSKDDYKMQLLLVGCLRRSCNETMQGFMLNCPEIIDEDKRIGDATLDLPAFSHNLFDSFSLSAYDKTAFSHIGV